MQYAIWKHYNQHASSHSDDVFHVAGTTLATARLTMLELFSEVNPDDELSDDELKALIEEEGAIDTGDFSLILMSDQHTGEGTFELVNGAASQTSERSVQYCL